MDALWDREPFIVSDLTVIPRHGSRRMGDSTLTSHAHAFFVDDARKIRTSTAAMVQALEALQDRARELESETHHARRELSALELTLDTNETLLLEQCNRIRQAESTALGREQDAISHATTAANERGTRCIILVRTYTGCSRRSRITTVLYFASRGRICCSASLCREKMRRRRGRVYTPHARPTHHTWHVP